MSQLHIKLLWLSYIIQALVKSDIQATTSFDRVHQQLFEMSGSPELGYVSTLNSVSLQLSFSTVLLSGNIH